MEEIKEEPKQNDGSRALPGFQEPTSQAHHGHNEAVGAALKLHPLKVSKVWIRPLSGETAKLS